MTRPGGYSGAPEPAELLMVDRAANAEPVELDGLDIRGAVSASAARSA